MSWLLLAALAFGAPAEVEVVVLTGALYPATPARVQVAAVDGSGAAVDPESVKVDKGTLLLETDGRASRAVHSYLYTPPALPGSVAFTVRSTGKTTTVLHTIVVRPQSAIRAPSRVDGLVGRAVGFNITAPGLTVEDLVVRTGEPSGVSVRAAQDGVVRVELQPTGQGARVVLVGLRDRRSAGRVKVVRVRLHQRHDKTFDLEPGARMGVRVGDRDYGPFFADEQGRVAAGWEQHPGEALAVLTTSDDLGNSTQSAYPMAALDPAPLLAEVADPWPGDLPPTILLHVARADGTGSSRVTPRCRAPGTGELKLHRVAIGRWVVGLPPRPVAGLDLRVSCEVGSARGDLRLPAPTGRAHRLVLRAWPEELSTDFPVSEVTVHLEDVRGERLVAEGLQLTADRGVVVLHAADSPSRRAEYQGGIDAVRQGYDTIRAAWHLPMGEGDVHRVQVVRGPLDSEGQIAIHARALDRQGRPIAGAALEVGLGDVSRSVVSAEDGWATASIAPTGSMLQMWARSGGYERRALALLGGPVDEIGPGLADLDAHASVRLTAGRVSTVRLELDTPVLHTGPTAVLRVRVYLYDRAENLVLDEIPVITSSVGDIGPPRRLPDGGYEAEYQPPPGARAQTVSIIARSPTGSASGTRDLRLEPRPVLFGVGAGVGVISNLSMEGINTAFFTVDADKRLPVFNDQLMARVGIAGYSVTRTVTIAENAPSGGDVEVLKRLTLIPVSISALARQDWGRNSTWLGFGFTLAPFTALEQHGARTPVVSVGVLPPGFSTVVGAGRRFGYSEVIFEFRGTFLASPGGDSGFQGQVGGLGAVLGIRRVFD
ncbi:MAG: hypothetical protein ACI9MC_003824 [Kiritimatiellia bacterium]